MRSIAKLYKNRWLKLKAQYLANRTEIRKLRHITNRPQQYKPSKCNCSLNLILGNRKQSSKLGVLPMVGIAPSLSSTWSLFQACLTRLSHQGYKEQSIPLPSLLPTSNAQKIPYWNPSTDLIPPEFLAKL